MSAIKKPYIGGRFGGFDAPNYTQVPNKFFDMISEMSDNELRVTLILIRETYGHKRESAKAGIAKISKLAGTCYNSAATGAQLAEKRGTFRRINPNSQGEAEWELVELTTSPDDTPSSGEGHPPHAMKTPPSPDEGQVGDKKVKEIKETKPADKTFIDPIDHALEFARTKAPTLELSLAIESALKVKLGLDATGTKGGMEFVNFAVKQAQKGEDYQAFIAWWIANGGERKFWSFRRMREMWPAAFMTNQDVIVTGGKFYA